MTYNIFSSTAPAMPKPAKGTEIVKLLLSQVSKEMREPLLPMTIPALAAHVANVELIYSDNKYHELCGQMGHLIGPSGIGKDQLHDLVLTRKKTNPALLRNKVGFSGHRKGLSGRKTVSPHEITNWQ